MSSPQSDFPKTKGGIGMIVIIPSEEDKITICESFGRTPFFLVYNTENQKFDFIHNPAATEQSGAGIKAAQFVVDQRAAILITKRCGENSGEVLKEAGIIIYKAEKQILKDLIEDFNEEKLEPLLRFSKGFGVGV